MSLEAEFDLAWRAVGGPPLEREVTFAPPRRWRFDFAHRAARVAIELDGGAWIQGRHVRPIGFLRDLEKLNTAALRGWIVFRLTRELLTPAWLEPIRDLIAERSSSSRDIRTGAANPESRKKGAALPGSGGQCTAPARISGEEARAGRRQREIS